MKPISLTKLDPTKNLSWSKFYFGATNWPKIFSGRANFSPIRCDSHRASTCSTVCSIKPPSSMMTSHLKDSVNDLFLNIYSLFCQFIVCTNGYTELVCKKIKMIHLKVLITKHHNSKDHAEQSESVSQRFNKELIWYTVWYYCCMDCVTRK